MPEAAVQTARQSNGGFIVNGEFVPDIIDDDDEIQEVARRTTPRKAPAVVDLSGDEEEEVRDADVALVAVKPLATSRLLSEDPPLSVYNYEIRVGRVKEYIEDGLGIIYNSDTGVVLFHVNHIRKNNPNENAPIIGTRVYFAVYFTRDVKYEKFSLDGHLCQAAAVWRSKCRNEEEPGEAEINEIRGLERESELLEYATIFSNFFEREVLPFTPLSDVRTRGNISEYVSCGFGIINFGLGDKKKRAFFHMDDVCLFSRAPFVQAGSHPGSVLPPGLSIAFDCIRLDRVSAKGVRYQAVAVFVGKWPFSPHPTSFPGGPGSVSCYDDTADSTFYYVSLSLPPILNERLRGFEACLLSTNFMPPSPLFIRNANDYYNWLSGYTNVNPNNHGKRKHKQRDSNHHSFRKKFPKKKEEDIKEITIKIEMGNAHSSSQGPAPIPIERIKIEKI